MARFLLVNIIISNFTVVVFCKLIFALMAMIKDLICATSDMEGAHTFMQNACIIMYNNTSLKEES